MSATTTPWRRPFGRLILGACAAAALAVPAMAQPTGQVQAAPAAPTDPAVAPHRDFPGDVVGFTDVAYSRIVGFRPMKLDLYVAKTKSGPPKPLVIWLHGGGWVQGDQHGGGIATPAYRDWPATLASLAAHGYVVASVAYRFSSEAQYPAPLQDVKASIRWLRANAAAYNIDPNKVVIWGGSAGGHLANMIGVSCNVPELEGMPAKGAETSSCVQAVIDFYGPSDFSAAESQRISDKPSRFGELTPNASLYLGCPLKTCPADKLRLSNPIAFINKSTPPFLIVQGAADGTVPPKQSQMLYDALQKAGVKSELVMVPGVDHVFAGATDAQGKEIYDKVVAFLDQTTKSR